MGECPGIPSSSQLPPNRTQVTQRVLARGGQGQHHACVSVWLLHSTGREPHLVPARNGKAKQRDRDTADRQTQTPSHTQRYWDNKQKSIRYTEEHSTTPETQTHTTLVHKHQASPHPIPVCLYLFLCLYVSVCLSFSLFLFLYLFLWSLFLYICLSVCLSLSFSRLRTCTHTHTHTHFQNTQWKLNQKTLPTPLGSHRAYPPHSPLPSSKSIFLAVLQLSGDKWTCPLMSDWRCSKCL